MNKSSRIVLAVVLLFSMLSLPGCKQKVSNVTITSLTGKGSFIAGGPNWDAILRFSVSVSNSGEADATITNWVAEIKEGDTVVIQISKSSPGDCQSAITPDPTSTYSISAGSTLEIKLNKQWVDKIPDPYGGKNPSTIKLTITVQDEESTYTIEMTSSFVFFRA